MHVKDPFIQLLENYFCEEQNMKRYQLRGLAHVLNFWNSFWKRMGQEQSSPSSNMLSQRDTRYSFHPPASFPLRFWNYIYLSIYNVYIYINYPSSTSILSQCSALNRSETKWRFLTSSTQNLFIFLKHAFFLNPM